MFASPRRKLEHQNKKINIKHNIKIEDLYNSGTVCPQKLSFYDCFSYKLGPT